MQSEVPKQFLEISGIPVLMHTIRVFRETSPEIELILVIPKQHRQTWDDLCTNHSFGIPLSIAYGGITRFHSVKNGLALVKPGSLIAIHDGVRPLVSPKVILNSFTIAEKYGTAIPAMPVTDSIRQKVKNTSKVLDRKEVRLIQTPQTFTYDILEKAYKQEFNDSFTDDSSVVEAAGYKIHLFEGNIENIKITRNIDLKIAEALIG